MQHAFEVVVVVVVKEQVRCATHRAKMRFIYHVGRVESRATDDNVAHNRTR